MENIIDVPEYVMEAYEEVRKSGKTNMFDCNAVLYYMCIMGFNKAAIWLSEEQGSRIVCNRKKYSEVLRLYSDMNRLAESLTK